MACPAKTTPKLSGEVSTSWRLRAGQMYSGEEITPPTSTRSHPAGPRMSKESPGARSKWSAMCSSTSTAPGAAGSRYEPESTLTWLTLGCESLGSETTRPRSLSSPTRKGRSATVRTSTEATPSASAAAAPKASTSPPETVRLAKRNSVNVRS